MTRIQVTIRSLVVRILPVLAVFMVTGCATVRDIVHTLKPDVRITDVRLASLSFEAVDLLVDIDIANPNPLPMTLAGVDYDLKINSISFLQGEQAKPLRIDPLGETVFQIPITLNYRNLYETFRSLKDQDITAYNFDCGLAFELPGLGLTRIPLSTSGEFPAVKLPALAVDGLNVKKINMTGADMELQVRMKNPNAFDIMLNRLQYEFLVNGKPWATGMGLKQVQVESKTESTLTIPISLDFAQVGRTVYQVVSGEEHLDYAFKGSLDLGSSLPLLDQATLPFNTSGLLTIRR